MKNPLSGSIISTLKDSLSKDKEKITLDFSTQIIKGYLKREVNSVYSFIDKESSIKLIFNDSFVKHYLSTMTPYTDYDHLENYSIILKKYRYDYLIFPKENQISFKLICYVDNFEIDQNAKQSSFDNLSNNINFNSEISQLSEEIVGKTIREILMNELSTNSDNPQFTAKNFILKNYNDNPNGNSENIITILKKACKVEDDMFLLKLRKSVDNLGYLYDDNESKTNYALKSLDWKMLFANMPSLAIRTKNGNKEAFVANKEALSTLIEKVSNREDIAPSELELNADVTDERIKDYLIRNTKRQSKARLENKSFPDNILNIMKKYGDVLANVGNKDIMKYKRFKKYSTIIEE